MFGLLGFFWLFLGLGFFMLFIIFMVLFVLVKLGNLGIFVENEMVLGNSVGEIYIEFSKFLLLF